MKKALIMLMVVALALPAAGAITFKDVPADHWAAKAVYDLVNMGVTTGYPDGTFRGTKNITRYETAIFLSKLANKMEGGGVGASELNALKREIASIRGMGSASGISGSVEMDGKVGNLLTSGTGRGPLVNYRVKTTLARAMGDGASVKINLDTLDSGYNGAVRNFPMEMLDIEGKVLIKQTDLGLDAIGVSAPLNVTLTAGPGPIQHTDTTGIVPSENGLVYERPDSGVIVDTKLMDADISGGYKVAAGAMTGKVNTSQLTGTVGYTFTGVPYLNTLKSSVTGDYLIKHPVDGGDKDLRAMMKFEAPLAPKVDAKGKISMGKSDSKGWMVGGVVMLNDLWDTGTNIALTGSKVGSQFITNGFEAEEFDFAGLDNFDRPLEAATVNLGGALTQTINDKLALVGKGDLRMSPDFGYGEDKAKSRLTGQIGVTYGVAKSRQRVETILD